MGTDETDPADEGYGPEAIKVLEGLEPPRRPWQLMATGDGAVHLSGKSIWRNLECIFELFPSLKSLTLHTTSGSCTVCRDFPSGYTEGVDDALAAIFRNNPAVTGIEFPAAADGTGHTATPDDPYWSADGKQWADIRAAMERGEITPQQAIDQFDQLIAEGPKRGFV